MSARFEAEFASRSRAEWVARFSGTDACVSPVWSFAEALEDDHLVARGTFVEIDGVPQPAPAPRFSQTPTATPSGPRSARPQGGDTGRILAGLGYSESEIGKLREQRAVR